MESRAYVGARRLERQGFICQCSHLFTLWQGSDGESLHTPERRALERLLRKMLKLPSQPGVSLLHCYSPNLGGAWCVIGLGGE